MRFRAILALLFCSLVTFSTASARADDDLTVSAAVSLKDVLIEAGKVYQKQTGKLITFNFGASGELATQIQQGGAVDLFISAAQKQVDDLVDSGEIDKDTPRTVVARNALVLIVPVGAKNPPTKFEDLTDPKRAEKIVIGEPKTVPAGQYAMEVFDALKIADAVHNRIVFASNVRQVLAYVERGEAPAGVVYQTDAMSAPDKVKIAAVAHEKLHEPIEYPAVVIKSSKHAAQANGFIQFLQSKQAQSIFKNKGFIIP